MRVASLIGLLYTMNKTDDLCRIKMCRHRVNTKMSWKFCTSDCLPVYLRVCLSLSHIAVIGYIGLTPHAVWKRQVNKTTPYKERALNYFELTVGDCFQYLMMRGQLKEALWVATAAHEGNINPPVVPKRSCDSLVNGVVDKDYDSQGYVHRNGFFHMHRLAYGYSCTIRDAHCTHL